MIMLSPLTGAEVMLGRMPLITPAGLTLEVRNILENQVREGGAVGSTPYQAATVRELHGLLRDPILHGGSHKHDLSISTSVRIYHFSPEVGEWPH